MATVARPVEPGSHHPYRCDGSEEFPCPGCGLSPALSDAFEAAGLPEDYSWAGTGGDEVLRALTPYTFRNAACYLDPETVAHIATLLCARSWPTSGYLYYPYLQLRDWFTLCAAHKLGVECSY